MKIKLLLIATVVLSLIPFSRVSAAQNDEAKLDSSIEAMRADLRANKVTIITDSMQFDDSDSKIFWPIYRKYEVDLANLNDKRVDLIKSYAENYSTMTDGDAQSMMDESFRFETNRISLRKKYASEFEKAGLSPLTVAKFMQLEHRLDLLMDLKIAANLPPILKKHEGQSTPSQ